MNIGVLCPSEIALRRFMPSLMKVDNICYIGIAINSPSERYGDKKTKKTEVDTMLAKQKEKALEFVANYGGDIFNSYSEIINSPKIEAIYIPLPPALHFKWAKKALEAGKHVLIEKPSTTSFEETQELIRIAKKNKLALHENYMFIFHSQIKEIDEIINNNEIGEVRLFSIKFGFPLRSPDDFRYNKLLGGGALIDAGGYCIKYANYLLGGCSEILYSTLNETIGFEVDMFGSGAMINKKGIVAQFSFGMDNDYRCELEVWGSEGTLKTGRILTAPAGFEPSVIISRNGVTEERKLNSDDSFKKSIQRFVECIECENSRINNYEEIELQSFLVEKFKEIEGINKCHTI